ncbi:MAG: DNA repair exonuclease [Planctomycetia bacterium]|nr:DNA repair exonuclease [Planctomycetia bacterium]
MRIAHLADLHLGRQSAADPNGSRRLHALRGAMARISIERPDAILVAGDVFDSPRVDEVLVCQAARVLESARTLDGQPIPTVVIPGNHDPADSIWLWRTFSDALTQDSKLNLVRSAECATLCGGRLLVEAYPCESRYSPLPPWSERVQLQPGTAHLPHVVLAHGTLAGGPVPEGESDAYPFTLAEAEALGADYVALGHFHGVYPPWGSNDIVHRQVCYAGTYDPDQFGSDAGWAILAIVEKGQPSQLQRIAVGRSRWELVEIGSATDLAQLAALKAEIEQDNDPQRFVLRLKLDRSTQLDSPSAAKLARLEEELTVLGAHVDRRGQLRMHRDPASLDLAVLPDGAIKQTLLSLREEWAVETDPSRRQVFAAALELGCRAFEE